MSFWSLREKKRFEDLCAAHNRLVGAALDLTKIVQDIVARDYSSDLFGARVVLLQRLDAIRTVLEKKP